MAGAFSWGSEGKSASKGGKLPRHIERMNAGTKPPEAKGSVMKGGKSMSDSGLPWGGSPSEKSKAFATGLPKNKGSVTSKTGERTKSVGSLPQGDGKALGGHKMVTMSKPQPSGKKKK